MTCLNDYLKEKNVANIIEEVIDADLPEVLYKFYSEVKPQKAGQKSNSDTYANTTLKCMRAGINRYMKQKKGIDIINDICFVKSNDLFKDLQVVEKNKGKGMLKHKDVIETEDIERSKDYFSKYMQPSAIVLQ